MALTTIALNQAADGVAVDTIQLHSGSPTAAGTANVIASTDTAISLGAASGGVRSMSAALDIAVPASTVSHYTLWSGGVIGTCKAFSAFATPETYASPGTARITSATLTAS